MNVEEGLLILKACCSVAEFYCISSHSDAKQARKDVAKASFGRDPFHTRLFQDLRELTSFETAQLEQAIVQESRVKNALEDLGSQLAESLNPDILDDLSDLERRGYSSSQTRNVPVDARTIMFKDSPGLLSLLHDPTSDRSAPAPLESATPSAWLRGAVDFRCPIKSRRDDLTTHSNNTVKYLRKIFPDPNADVAQDGLSDLWAEPKFAAQLGLLDSFHSNHIKDWNPYCSCGHDHIHSSFPTIGGGANECTLITCSDHGHRIQKSSAKSLHGVPTGTFAEYHYSTSTNALWALGADEKAEPGPIALTPMREAMLKANHKKRVALALLLAYAFMELGGGPWWPYENDQVDIFVMQRPHSPNPDMLQPVLVAPLSQHSPTSPIDNAARMRAMVMGGEMPALFALGKVILELLVGRVLENDDKVFKELVSFEDDHPDRYLCLAAVKACMGIKDKRLGLTAEALRNAVIRGNKERKKRYLREVVHKLNSHLQYGCGISLEHVLARTRPKPNVRTSAQYERRGTVSLTTATGSHLPVCFNDNYEEETPSQHEVNESKAWFRQLDTVHQFVSQYNTPERRVRVAVLDTGVKFGGNYLSKHREHLKECRSWIDGKKAHLLHDFGDADSSGHGTHVVSVIHSVAPICDVYVAQVFGSRAQKAAESTSTAEAVAQAIYYCVQEWKVDAISLSFGYRDPNRVIDDAIRYAYKEKVLMFAAAGNWGGNHPMSWPARHDAVISTLALTGLGNQYRGNPTVYGNKHVAALGTSVPAWSCPRLDDPEQESTRIYRSGTSMATPIVVGITALVLHVVLGEEGLPNREATAERLKDPGRMHKVLSLMTEGRHGLNYLVPWLLLKDPAPDVDQSDLRNTLVKIANS